MNTNIVPDLRYVELQTDTAFIDSRVYCREVIEVDHHDWFNNILKKHQTVIEQHFGIVRFENALTGKRGMPEIYALLTEPQTNFALTLSRNTAKTMQRKAELIADFEQAKQFVRQTLTQRFATADTVTQLKSALNNFPNTLEKVWETSGIVSKYQVKNSILRDFVEDRDYLWADGILCVSDSTFHILSISFRSLKGANIDQLPEIINLKTREYFRYQANKKANRLIPQNSEWEQLTLWNSESSDWILPRL